VGGAFKIQIDGGDIAASPSAREGGGFSGVDVTDPTIQLPGTVAIEAEIPNPGAGAHTFTIVWKVLGGFEMVIDPTIAGDGQHASLVVEEVTV
jgi:hypothetical protein